MIIENNNIANQQFTKRRALALANTNTGLFIVGWIMLVVQYGTWQGQYTVNLATDQNKNAIFLIIFFLFVLGIVILRKNKLPIYLPNKWLLIIFFVNLFFACFLRDDIYSSIRQFVGVILSFVVAIFLSSLLQSLSIKRALSVFTLSIFVTLLVSTYIHLSTSGTLNFFNHTLSSRLGGLFFTAHFAMLAGLSGLFSLIWLLASNFKHHRAFNFINIILMSVFVVLTDTRSVMVAYVACGFLIYFLGFRKTFITKRIYLLAFVLGAGLFLYYYFYVVPPDAYRRESNLDLRSSIWQVSIDGILANPFIGYGRQNYLSGNFEAWSINPTLADSHNALLDHALQYGLFSVVIFFLYYVLLGLKVIRSTDSIFKGFVSLLMYWLAVSLFWGHLFNISGGMIQIIFLVTLFGFLCHPDIYRKKLMKKSIKRQI